MKKKIERYLVERRGIAPRSLQCERSVLLLNYRPRGPMYSWGSRRGRPRRNRTLSPGVGIPAGHHDSTACARAAAARIAFASRTLAAPRTGIEPSLHSMDSGAATPVASRGIHILRSSIVGVPGRSRTCVDRLRRPAPIRSATRTVAVRAVTSSSARSG